MCSPLFKVLMVRPKEDRMEVMPEGDEVELMPETKSGGAETWLKGRSRRHRLEFHPSKPCLLHPALSYVILSAW